MTMRKASIHRQTKETDISVVLTLDGSGESNINSGIPFFDHMLSHVALHGMLDLDLDSTGDLEVDQHHTIEDCALLLGQAFDQALGKRAGIARYGYSYVPMDDSLARAVIDFSGRPYWVIDIGWRSPDLAGIPCSIFEHFFQSFSVTARCNLHLHTLYGSDNHHLAEAAFKAFGRAIRQAVEIDSQRGMEIASTKGTLAG
jgi:imidazoleglycerol-phosphate dehydratase